MLTRSLGSRCKKRHTLRAQTAWIGHVLLVAALQDFAGREPNGRAHMK